MFVTTDIPCGNGRIRWISPGVFEIELIAYSKGARYTHFKIAGVKEDRRQEVVLRPDSFYRDADLGGLCCKIWIKRGEQGEWQALDESEVELAPYAIRFTLDLKAGEDCFISTEPPREYAQTTQELFDIAATRPEIAQIYCIGYSLEHRPIFALRVTDGVKESTVDEETKPVVLIHAGEHATEFSGEEMVRGMLQLVLSPQGEHLRSSFAFHFILNTNPDGNYHGWHQYNAKDWKAHNYSERVDRSWHHEFEDYFKGKTQGLSSETLAVGGWICRVKPVFVLGAHSWLGHKGNPGAFYVAPKLLDPDFGEIVHRLNKVAIDTSKSQGVTFEVFPSSNLRDGHMGPYLMVNRLCAAYTVEGHMNLGREKLQKLGAALLEAWLQDEELNFCNASSEVWESRVSV